jgi:hypothetical protein
VIKSWEGSSGNTTQHFSRAQRIPYAKTSLTDLTLQGLHVEEHIHARGIVVPALKCVSSWAVLGEAPLERTVVRVDNAHACVQIL